MQSSMIQPAADAAGRLHASLINILRHLGADQVEDAKTLLAQIHGPLGDLVSQLGRILPVCTNESLRFQVETTQFNHLREIGTDPDDPLVPFTISLVEGIEITCGPRESVSRGDRPIIFIERHTTGRTLCVNSPDNGDPAAVVTFHADGSATVDDIPWWNSRVKNLRHTPMCGIVQGDFTTGFRVVGPFRTQDDAKASDWYREGMLIVDFWLPDKPKGKAAGANGR